MPKLTVTVDPNLCIGAAACVDSASRFFHLDEDNIATVSVSQPIDATGEEHRQLMDAAEGCPTGAIQVATVS